MDKKYFLYLIAFICISIITTKSLIAQNSTQVEQIYKISFEPIVQQEVKPLIGILMPIFNQVPFIEQGKYQSFYYKFSGDVAFSKVEELLQNTKYILLNLSIVDRKVYDKMIDQRLSPKN
jgi:hypothetical protein